MFKAQIHSLEMKNSELVEKLKKFEVLTQALKQATSIKCLVNKTFY